MRADETYRVAITAVNAAGVATPFALTLYYGLHLITDRTQADVSRVSILKDRTYPRGSDGGRETGMAGRVEGGV